MIKRWGKRGRNSEIRNWEIEKRKSKGENPKATLYGKKSFTKKEKTTSNLPTSSINSKKTATCIFRHSTSSFGNKPLVTLDWYLKTRKRHRRSSSYDQSERIRGKIFFYKEYCFWDWTPTFLILINILFALFLLLFCLHRRTIYEICAHKFLALPMGHLYLSSLLLKDWSLLCWW